VLHLHGGGKAAERLGEVRRVVRRAHVRPRGAAVPDDLDHLQVRHPAVPVDVQHHVKVAHLVDVVSVRGLG